MNNKNKRLCPDCGSENYIKNGSFSNGKPKYECKLCGRQFVDNPQNAPLSAAKKALVDRLLLGKIPLVSIARAAQVSERWGQYYVNKKYAEVPRQVHVTAKKKGRLTIEGDEMGAFV